MSSKMQRKAVKDRLKDLTGMRQSPRLEACVDIFWAFFPVGWVTREDATGSCFWFAELYSDKAISRALAELTRIGVLQMGERKSSRGGGHYYHFTESAYQIIKS